VYIAGRYARRTELASVVAELERAGATITSRWLFAESRPVVSHELHPDARARSLAEMDLQDLRKADVCLAFTEPAEAPQGRGGRHTEFGVALALGARVIVVGPREHVFHCLATVEQFDDWPTARRSLGLETQSHASGGVERVLSEILA
jgi:nucleoside 2-deoxyribosyltransferase